MYVLHDDVLVFFGDIIVAEVPVRADPAVIELVDQVLDRFFRHRQDRGVDLVFLDILFDGFIGQYRDTSQCSADQPFVLLKDRGQLEAELFEIQVSRDRSSEVARADQDRVMRMVKPEDLADLLAQTRYAVAVALLTEPAEAVQILSDLLRSCLICEAVELMTEASLVDDIFSTSCASNSLR